jgi:hypothetical protein
MTKAARPSSQWSRDSSHHGGLQLKIAKDQATVTAIRRSIEKLVDVSVADLQAKATMSLFE